MGNWTIHIEGTGCHHNKAPYDAESIARKAVNDLKLAGHTIQHASFNAGGAEDLELPQGDMSIRDQLVGALYRIAQGVETPREAAVHVLKETGHAVPVNAPVLDEDR